MAGKEEEERVPETPKKRRREKDAGEDDEDTDVEETPKKAKAKADEKKTPTKKKETELTEEEEAEKRKRRQENFLSYKMREMRRQKPLNPGSKEIPVGEPFCLQGLKFVFTGDLEALSREEVTDLVRRYGGMAAYFFFPFSFSFSHLFPCFPFFLFFEIL